MQRAVHRQCGVMIVINACLSLQLQIILSRRGNLQGRGKMFLAGRIGYVAARKRGSEHGPLEELKGFCVAGA